MTQSKLFLPTCALPPLSHRPCLESLHFYCSGPEDTLSSNPQDWPGYEVGPGKIPQGWAKDLLAKPPLVANGFTDFSSIPLKPCSDGPLLSGAQGTTTASNATPGAPGKDLAREARTFYEKAADKFKEKILTQRQALPVSMAAVTLWSSLAGSSCKSAFLSPDFCQQRKQIFAKKEIAKCDDTFRGVSMLQWIALVY